MTTNTASMRQSDCSSIPIPQDKSAYWFPVRRFHSFFIDNNIYRIYLLCSLASLFPVSLWFVTENDFDVTVFQVE